MSTLNTARSLVDEAHRLLRDSSPSSTASDYDPRNRNYNSKGKAKAKPNSARHHKSSSTSQHKISIPQHYESVPIKKTEHLAHPSSCSQEKGVLRAKIHEMEKIINKQSQKIDMLKDQLKAKESQIKKLEKQAVNSLTKDLILEDMERMMKEMQKNELVLVKQLSEQQKIAKDALNKLYASKEETSYELQNLKRNYQSVYSIKLEEERKQYESKIEELRHENDRIMTEMHESQDNDKMEVSNKLGMEVIKLNSEVSQKTLENAKLKMELVDLKDTLARARRSSQGSLVTMNERDAEIRVHSARVREKDDENMLLKIGIERLREELLVKEKQMKDQEKRYQDKVYKIEEKVRVIHDQTRLAEEYSKEIQVLRADLSRKEREILKMQNYFMQKLESRRVVEESQNKEWEEAANEFQDEIRHLKAEVNSLLNSRRGSLSSRRMS